MEMEEAFKLAQADTKFIKVRKNLLYTFGATRLPYICLSQSSDNAAMVTVRTGEVTADKPQIALPGEMFSLEGFDHDDSGDESEGLSVLLARRISMPPSKYVNRADSTVKENGTLADAIHRYMNRLENENDVRTGIISAGAGLGPVHIIVCWEAGGPGSPFQCAGTF